ncbi:hypothetical protein C8J57DRAFT_1329459 [Mycena rebaudengoi]|nr:hypothetical protein C8J57DRAFT_1329459 [Mycena rebaudengoi]
MPVPQEIVDKTIDNVSMDSNERPDWDVEPYYEEALRACALASRSFRLRSQMHLFAAIRCFRESNSGNVLLVDRLLVESPHIRLCVRHLRLVGVPGDFPADVLPDSILVSRILSLLPNLARLDVVSVSDRQIGFPTAVEGVLSLLSMRTLHLSGFTFPHAAALDSLLSHATSLQDLSLEDISFHDHSVGRPSPAPCTAAVVLASLKLKYIGKRSIDAVLATFSAVDIRHLRDLYVERTPSAMPLLAANTQTIQKVQYCFSDGKDMKDADILAGNTSLHSIEVIEPNDDMASSLKAFGNLGHLTALKTISLHFNDPVVDFPPGVDGWGELDAILTQAGDGLQDVRIYAFADGMYENLPELAAVDSWLPSVAGRISVHIPTQMR